MNDLLASIKDGRDSEDGGRRGGKMTKTTNVLYAGDIEEGYEPPGGSKMPTEADTDMQGFFESVEELKVALGSIASLLGDIKNLNEQGRTMVKTKAIQKQQQEMQEMIARANKISALVKVRLELLDKENDVARAKTGQGPGTASERTRTALTAGLKKKLKDLMGEFSDLRTRIQDEYREVVARRIKTVSGQDVPDDEIDMLIESGEGESIFQKAILEQGRGRVLDTLAEIQERHRAVKDLEQSLLELHQMFLDMAVLVDAQGEMVDNIQKHVEKSADYVTSGLKALQEARELQKNTRKWMCCGLVLLLVIALVIVVVIVKPWKYIG